MREFNEVEDLNIFYANKLLELGEVSENCNDDVLKKMLKNLMKDYDTNYKILRHKIKFENKVLKKRVKVSNNMRKAELSHELRKIRYIIRQRKIENWKDYFKFRKDYNGKKDEYKKLNYENFE